MRVLLVTFSEYLPVALTQVLNPALEYCTIVVDEPEVAKKILANVPPLRDKIFPFYELKECIENNYYDFVLLISTFAIDADIRASLKEYGVSEKKFVEVVFPATFNFQVERALRYYKEHVQDFEMFATGMSYTRYGLMPKIFKRKLFNLACDGQDLYYDYKTANEVMRLGGGGRIKYALIGLSQYIFQWDLSLSYGANFRVPQYLTAFNDLHNFWMPLEEYRKIFRPEYLNYKMPLSADMYNDAGVEGTVKHIERKERINARKGVDGWKNKSYPETVKENVKILDDYLTLCEKNKVRPIMFLPPLSDVYKKHFNRKILDEFYYLIREAQKKHPSAAFLDGWKLKGFSDDDFMDIGHMNLQGAAKFSTMLNNAIESLEKG